MVPSLSGETDYRCVTSSSLPSVLILSKIYTIARFSSVLPIETVGKAKL